VQQDTTQTQSQTLTVLYDGRCGFCTRQARLAARVAGAERTRLVSTAMPGVREHYGLTADGVRRQLYVRDGTGRLWGGAGAVARLVRAVPVVGVVGWLYLVPGLRQVADALYGWISAHRQQISRRLGWDAPGAGAVCEDGSCELPRREAA
jgi:predicted DCC family thiol-disulfide oxidoreductase YuxK